MISGGTLLPVDRFIATLKIVYKEGRHLQYSRDRLYSESIDANWVIALEHKPEKAERLEAFVSRFGRMQDTIADKLLPRWLQAQAESVGSQIEVLNRGERLGVISNVEHWLEARKLRNRLIHEYMEAPPVFAEDIVLAKEYSALLFSAYNNIREHALTRLQIDSVSSIPVFEWSRKTRGSE